MGTNWVDVWEGLRGTRDFRAVVECGNQLHDALIVARRAWSERETVHRAALEAAREVGVEELLELHECGGSELADGLVDVIRSWHDTDHAEAWAVCPHVVCRTAAAA